MALDPRWLALFFLGLLGGCTTSDRPGWAQEWESLDCDASGPDWIGGGVEPVGFWGTEALDIGDGFSNATGQVLAQHRSAGSQKHQWSIFENGTLKGNVEATLHSVGGWSEWRLVSEAGFPAGKDPGDVVGRILAGLDPEGKAAVERTDTNEAGIRMLNAWQMHDGRPVIDPFTGYGVITGYHTATGGSWLFVRPVYDLTDTRIRVSPEDAEEKALEYWTCARGGDIIVDRVAWAVVYGTLAYAVDLDERAAASLGCIPPVLVDAASGAVLGQATTAICTIPEDAPGAP